MRVGQQAVGHPVDVASGIVYMRRLDVSIKGRLPINWVRSYSTAAAGVRSPQGSGWSTHYSAELTRAADDSFTFYHMGGAAGTFREAAPLLARGETVRDLGSNAELSLQAGSYVVSLWDPESLAVNRYVFREAARDGQLLLTSLEDATGIGIDFDHDANRRLTMIRQRLAARALGVFYNGRELISGVSALDGQTWRPVAAYVYDAQDRLVRASDAMGHTEEYQYDAAGRLTTEKTRSGGVFDFVFDGQGRCIKTSGLNRYDEKSLVFKDHIGWTDVTDSLGHLTRFHWNENGQVLHEIDPVGRVTTTEYDEYGRILARIFPGGRRLTYEYDDAGNRKTITDPIGRKLRFAFNSRHQVTELTDPKGNVWTSEYDGHGRWIRHCTPLGSAWKFEYDDRGNLTATVDPRGLRSRVVYLGPAVWEFHDYAGNVIAVTENYLGRVIRRIEPSGKETTYSHDAAGRLNAVATSSGTDIRYEYDGAGNVTSVRDSLGAVTTFRFGTCRRLLERTDRVGQKRRFIWGSEPDRLLEIINENGESYRIEYDPTGRISREITFSGASFRYEYDAAGFRSAFLDEAGARTEYTRDAAGQLLALQAQEGERFEYAYDAMGDLTRAAGPGSEIGLTRDAHGRVIREEQDGITLEFGFDIVGALTRIVSSAGTEIVFGYDGASMPVSAQNNGQELWHSRRDADRREVERRLPGGMRILQAFDQNGSLRSQRLTRDTSGQQSVLIEREFRYDVAARLIAVQDSVWGETHYSYDPAERIIAASSGQGEERFSYDSAGNLLDVASGSTAIRLEWAAGNRLTRAGDVGFEYDAAGRVSFARRFANGAGQVDLALTWGHTDRLTSVAVGDMLWTYRYDALGRRVEKRGPRGTVRFIWAGDTLLQEVSSTGRSRTWITPPGTFTPLAMTEGRQTFAIISDVIGTPRDVVDSGGNLRWSALYSTWGCVKASRGDLQDFPIRFPGQYHDDETGLHYSRFRYYDPRHGRFLSPDPLGLYGGLNEYAYALNPIGWIDPLGLIVVYRNLRSDEDPSKGLSAVQPGRDMSPAGHVMNGSRDNFKGSQYISTTTDPAVAEQWRKEGQTQVRFDTDRVVPDSKGNLNVLDISDREKAIDAGLKGRAVGYAASSKEMLVEGHVPPDAIEKVPPKEEEEKAC
jgi:RHS repeat-associated protein